MNRRQLYIALYFVMISLLTWYLAIAKLNDLLSQTDKDKITNAVNQTFLALLLFKFLNLGWLIFT